MARDFVAMEDSNRSSNPSIHGVGAPKIAFKPIPPGMGDKLVVPEGDVAKAIAAWGEPVGAPGTR
jgi:hypothetical protein